MRSICEIKEELDNFEVEFELISPMNNPAVLSEEKREIQESIDSISAVIEEKERVLEELNSEIDRLTNNADSLDYAIAVTCGLITGIIDSVFVGEWDFKSAKAQANKDVNEMVIDFARKDPEYKDYLENKRTSNSDLENAISFLENKYKLPGDGEYKRFKSLGVTDKTHHLDDFSHHPTLVGLVCSVIVQFSEKNRYHCSSGKTTETLPVQVNQYGELISPHKWGKVFAGVVNWFFTVAKTAANQKGHLLSDIAGSSSSAKKGNDGAGVPGGFLSTLKELSSLPIFKDTQFEENLRKAFQNGIGEGKSQLDLGPFNALFEGASSKFDARTEKAIAIELKRQAVPVLLNEILVRSCYFIRRVIIQMKDKDSILELDLKETMPFNNRTIVRMITIASGTFTAVDLADAAIRSAVKSGGIGSKFLSNMILRVNFVGLGRFAVAVGTDVGMGISRSKKMNKRIEILNEEIALTSAKVYYKSGGVWIAAEETDKSIEDMYNCVEESVAYYTDSIYEMTDNMKSVSRDLKAVPLDETRKKDYLRLLRR